VSKRIDDLKHLVEREEKCRAKHIESVVIKERFEGMRVWDGVVETFQLEGHPKAKRAYAWVVPATKDEEVQYTVVLGVPPINSAQDAVKASISKGLKDLIRLGRKIKFGE
jgi:hypothetical protein